MSASVKALIVSALLALMAGPTYAFGINSLEVDRSSCIAASDANTPGLDENSTPLIPPVEEEEEEEEPDCE